MTVTIPVDGPEAIEAQVSPILEMTKVLYSGDAAAAVAAEMNRETVM